MVKKKKHIWMGLGALPLLLTAQSHIDEDSVETRQTNIDLLYNHYLQDGNHSAITGGIGTEKLTVYSSNIWIQSIKKDHTLLFNTGVDVISSASTDKIDFVVSSASSKDSRYHFDVGYAKRHPNKKTEISINSGLSGESDYTSWNSKLAYSKINNSESETYGMSFQLYLDDLRWGRGSPMNRKPVKLIYPSELRNKDWYETVFRQSYNLNFAYTRLINKRTKLGVYPAIAMQKGLLATPFHRVYDINDKVSVEQLPYQRLKASVMCRVNTYIGIAWITKNSFQFYVDDFGIKSLSFDSEFLYKLNPSWTLGSNIRVYTQSASTYFVPYGEKLVDQKYATSDYDLSSFNRYQLGISGRYRPLNHALKKWSFSEISFRYAFMFRSDGMLSHVLSIAISADKIKKKKLDKRFQE